jgi:spore germination protein KB
MVAQEKISARQFTILVTLFSIGSAILIIPSTITFYAKQDAWLSTIIGIALGLGVVWLYYKVGNTFPSLNLVQLNEKLLGKWLGKTVVFLILGVFFIAGPVSNVFYIGNFMTSQIVPDTPVQSINILFMIIVVMGVRLGLETIARTAEILFALFLFLFIFQVLFILPQIEVENFYPILEFGIKPNLTGALMFLGNVTFPIVLLLMISPSQIVQKNKVRKALLIGNLMGGLVLLTIITLSIFVLGQDLTIRNTFPSYVLAKKINIGDFLQRIEVFMAFMWIISLYFRLSLYFYVMVTAISYIFNLKDYRPLVLPFGLILIPLAIIEYPNSVYDQYVTITFWVPFSLFACVAYPLLLLGLASIRKARGS